MTRKRILFIVIALALLQLASMAYDRIVLKDQYYKAYWILSKKNQKLDFVAVGSSRAASNVNIKALQNETGLKGQNIGVGGSSPVDEYLFLYNWLKNGNKADVMLLALDDDGLDTSSYGYFFHPYYFFPYLNRGETYAVTREAVGYRAMLYRYIPFFKYAEFNNQVGMPNIARIMEPPVNREFDEFGYKPNDGKFVLNVAKVEKKTVLRNSPIAVKYFLETIKLAKEHSMKVILFYPPDTYHVQNSRANREEIMAEYARMAKEQNVELHVYDHLLQFQDTDKYFKDTRHLNVQGSELFAKELAKLLVKK
jgi:hypothetical protein